MSKNTWAAGFSCEQSTYCQSLTHLSNSYSLDSLSFLLDVIQKILLNTLRSCLPNQHFCFYLEYLYCLFLNYCVKPILSNCMISVFPGISNLVEQRHKYLQIGFVSLSLTLPHPSHINICCASRKCFHL